MRGYRMVLIMPENQSLERQAMKAYGAEPDSGLPRKRKASKARAISPSRCRHRAGAWCSTSSPTPTTRSHYSGTGPEIWQQTNGEITHFVSAMGTTGTTSASELPEGARTKIVIVGAQPTDGSSIAGHPQMARGLSPGEGIQEGACRPC